MIFIEITGKADYYSNSSNLDNVYLFSSPCDVVSSKFMRKLCNIHLSGELNNIINLPFRKIWNKILIKYFNRIKNNSEEIIFIFNAHYYWIINTKLLNSILNNISNTYIAFYFSDKFSMYQEKYKKFPSIETLKINSNMLYTYNYIDSKLYDIDLMPPVFRDYYETLEINHVNFLDKYLREQNYQYIDLVFVGKNKGRIEEILDIYDKCVSVGLKCLFFVTDVPNPNKFKRENLILNKSLNYADVIKLSMISKAILNLVQKSGDGITLRDYEAFSYNKYLLTNNYILEQTPLFNDNQIIWLKNNFEFELKRKLQIPLEKMNYKNIYNEEKFYNWIYKRIKI